MLLEQLLHLVDYRLLGGNPSVDITGITELSGEVRERSMFVCIKGAHTDGHRYLPDAFSSGAGCVVVEYSSETLEALMKKYPETAVALVSDTMKALALIACSFYGEAAHRLTMIGITGTKGKTTTAYMINAILRRAGIACGMIGTLGAWYNEQLETPAVTTPDAVTLHRILAEMEKKGCTHVVLEVSSQSLMRRRVYGIPFKEAVFTNLYPDHIGEGEHQSFEEYRYWKSTLFAHAQISVLNQRADGYQMMAAMSAGKVINYRWDEEHPIQISLPGRFNQENALAAMTAAAALGVSPSAFEILNTLQIPGRTEILQGDGYRVVIDYAHNESSMENLLGALREMKPERLICIYGSGGNRSRIRRQGMGRAGGELADLSVLTADNSRNEPLPQILEGLMEGVESAGGNYLVIPDRREAIHSVIRAAKKGDLIAIIGKGHETCQEIGAERIPFSDREEARLAMNGAIH